MTRRVMRNGTTAIRLVVRIERKLPEGARVCPTCDGACLVLSPDGTEIRGCETCAGYRPDDRNIMRFGAQGFLIPCEHCGDPRPPGRQCDCDGARAAQVPEFARKRADAWAARTPVPWQDVGDVCCDDRHYDSVHDALDGEHERMWAPDYQPDADDLAAVELAPTQPVGFPSAESLADDVCERVAEHVYAEDWHVSDQASCDLTDRLREWVEQWGSEADGCWQEDSRRRVDLTGFPFDELLADVASPDDDDPGEAYEAATALESVYGPEDGGEERR